MLHSKTSLGYAAGGLAAFFWGFHAVLVRHLTESIPGVVVGVFRLYIASAALLLVLLLLKTKVTIEVKQHWLSLLAAGVFGVALNFLFFHAGLEYTTAANAMLIEGTAPIIVLIISAVVYKTKCVPAEIIAISLAFMGVILVVGGVDFTINKLVGDVLELLAAFTWAIFIIISSQITKNVSATILRLTYLLIVFIIGSIALTPALFIISFSMTAIDFLWILLLGIGPTAIAYGLWYEAASRLSVVASALLFNLSIVFTLLNSHFFLKEKPTLLMMAGSALIIIGMFYAQVKPVPRSQRNPAELDT